MPRREPKFEIKHVEKWEKRSTGPKDSTDLLKEMLMKKEQEQEQQQKQDKNIETYDEAEDDTFDSDAVYTRGGSGNYAPSKWYWRIGFSVLILGILIHKTSRDLGHWKSAKFNDQGCVRFETPTPLEDLAPLGDGHCGERYVLIIPPYELRNDLVRCQDLILRIN